MLRLFFILALFINGFASRAHQFYFSKTTVEWSQQTGRYAVTIKFFTDDLERAIGSSDQNPMRLGSEKENSEADHLIANYVFEHMWFVADQQGVSLQYVGKEVENDITWCYFEFSLAAPPRSFQISNSFFYELFPKQQNMVDVQLNGSVKTLLFTDDHRTETLLL